MACSANTLSARPRRLAALEAVRRFRLVALTIAFAPLATSAFGQTVNYYSGTDSAGFAVGIYTVATPQGEEIDTFGLTGHRYCNGVLVPETILGGNTDGTVLYPVVDGRATFSELRPDFFISADIRFLADGKVSGSAVFNQATYTGTNFPPLDSDASSCTTKTLTFTASYVGSTTLTKPSASSPPSTGK